MSNLREYGFNFFPLHVSTRGMALRPAPLISRRLNHDLCDYFQSFVTSNDIEIVEMFNSVWAVQKGHDLNRLVFRQVEFQLVTYENIAILINCNRTHWLYLIFPTTHCPNADHDI